MPSVGGVEEEEPRDSSEYKLRKQLLLLAALVVSVTYVAGLTPPGGVWQDDGPGVNAGGPVLRITHRRRFLSFYYCNSTALAASLVVIFLLLLKNPTRIQLAVLRLVMVLDLLGLMGAYLAGSCGDRPATVYATALVLALSAYVGVHILQGLSHSQPPPAPVESVGGGEEENLRRRAAASSSVLKPKERCKVLLLLATFTTALTYVAGLNPPGGFWDTLDGGRRGGYRPGDSLVEVHHRGHFRMFFYCNTTAFVASLFIIVLLLDKKLSARTARSFALHVFVLSALLGLLAAYDAGSCRDANCSVYVVSLFGAVLAFIFLTMVAIISLKGLCADPAPESNNNNRVHDDEATSPATSNAHGSVVNNAGEVSTANTIEKKAIKKVKSLVLLLANLAATVTYQAGLDPPGGFWPDDGEGHRAGDAILLSKDPARYKAFFYCNSAAFVVSLVVILMVQNVRLVKSHTLLVAMMLDMFALIGAYAAGSCRDLRTSVHVVALAGAVLAYVLVHVLFFTLRATDSDGTVPEKKHKRLLLVAILVATITYQVGLTPPGGFWIEENLRLGRHAGGAVLLDKYPRRFEVFFYCNTVSFMASIALILLLVNPNLSRLAIRCYALYACQVASLFGLMGAYAAGSARRLRTSIFALVLVVLVIAFFVANIIVFRLFKTRTSSASADAPAAAEEEEPTTARDAEETEYRDEVYAKRKYLMLLGILAASVTYQAGLAPPGGLWQDDGGGTQQREAGNPVLHDTDQRRYHVFFYSNSTSFVASVVVIALLLQQILRRHRPENHELLLLATNTAVVLDLLGLLAAYAAGSTREWGNVAVLPVLVLIFMAIHVAVWLFGERRRCSQGGGGGSASGRMEEQVVNGHDQSSHVENV
ncbi:hypothetical protein SEVIR_6G138000v4 [Setaria viridis]|uniref:PGG domain-containing protein n=2 Tax=Setaria TaxID=4554 RepID=K3YG71_SETIT|nr:uncharacterized protein LOC101782477 [Setaria italica]XP_034599150.1 uncharacterized protein LOC117860054 [Setaria viridis]RCV30822.1 hypothetical protein SETIT_6G126500v2 [Setaria italica]TKW09967.1 hypothetical protein SEVIR_6G138000v2 [Setaria viridis]